MKTKKVFAVTGIASILASIAIFSMQAYARPVNWTITEYYSDAAHTNWVGESELMCSGRSILEGTTSRYAVTTIVQRC